MAIEGVAKALRHDLEGDSGLEPRCGDLDRVANIVKPDRWEAGSLGLAGEGLGDPLGVVRRPVPLW